MSKTQVSKLRPHGGKPQGGEFLKREQERRGNYYDTKNFDERSYLEEERLRKVEHQRLRLRKNHREEVFPIRSINNYSPDLLREYQKETLRDFHPFCFLVPSRSYLKDEFKKIIPEVASLILSIYAGVSRRPGKGTPESRIRKYEAYLIENNLRHKMWNPKGISSCVNPNTTGSRFHSKYFMNLLDSYEFQEEE